MYGLPWFNQAKSGSQRERKRGSLERLMTVIKCDVSKNGYQKLEGVHPRNSSSSSSSCIPRYEFFSRNSRGRNITRPWNLNFRHLNFPPEIFNPRRELTASYPDFSRQIISINKILPVGVSVTIPGNRRRWNYIYNRIIHLWKSRHLRQFPPPRFE